MPRALYHFTSLDSWESIRDSKQLEPRSRVDTCSVLWLTDTPDGQAATGIAAERTDVRISVHPVQDVHPWQLYREEVPDRASILDTVGFGADAAMVALLPIPSAEWSSAHLVATGELLWSGEPAIPLDGPYEGWSLTGQQLMEFQESVIATIETMGNNGTLPDGDWLRWRVMFLPKQVSRLREWAESPGVDSRFRAWMGWRSLRGKAGQLSGLPTKWRTL